MRSFSTEFERSEIVAPGTFRNIGLSFNPEAKLVEIVAAEFAISHALDKMVADHPAGVVTSCEAVALLSEHEAAQLFAKTLGFCWIL